ncbi:MAG: hypothetical protein ACEPOV_14450 [Hyphomicrobiales bacterium]
MKNIETKHSKFDNKIQEKFNDFIVEPPLDIWSNIEKSLEDKDESKKVFFLSNLNRKHWSIAASIAIFLSISVSLFLTSNNDFSKDNIAKLNYINSNNGDLKYKSDNRDLLSFNSILNIKPEYNTKSSNDLLHVKKNYSQLNLNDEKLSNNTSSDSNKTHNPISQTIENNTGNKIGSSKIEGDIIQEYTSNTENKEIENLNNKQLLNNKFLEEFGDEENNTKHPLNNQQVAIGLNTGVGADYTANETNVNYTYIDIPLKYNLNDNFYVESGITYAVGQYKDRSHITFEKSSLIEVSDKVVDVKPVQNSREANRAISECESDDYNFQTIETNLYDTTIVSGLFDNNHTINRIEIPAYFGYTKNIGLFRLNLKAGPSLGFLVSQSNDLTKPSPKGAILNRIVKSRDKKVFKKNVYFQLNLAPNIVYAATNKLNITFQPQWRIYLNDPYSTKVSRLNFDMKIGVSYCFKY